MGKTEHEDGLPSEGISADDPIAALQWMKTAHSWGKLDRMVGTMEGKFKIKEKYRYTFSETTYPGEVEKVGYSRRSESPCGLGHQ